MQAFRGGRGVRFPVSGHRSKIDRESEKKNAGGTGVRETASGDGMSFSVGDKKKCLRRYHMNEALKEVRTRAGNRGLRGQF